MAVAEEEILFDLFPIFRQYTSGRIVRNHGSDFVSAGIDSATGVSSKDVVIDHVTGLSVRLHLPSTAAAEILPVLVFFHGGAFLVGSAYQAPTHNFLNELAAKAGVLAVSVEYRLAPEHPLPAAYEDSWAALRWITVHCGGGGPEEWLSARGDFGRVFLAGMSAGGNIAHQMAMRAGAEGLVAGVQVEGLVLLHPYFWGRETVGNEGRDPEFRAKEENLWRFVCPESEGVDDPCLNPMAAEAPCLAKVVAARTLVAVAELDWLRERGRLYYESLMASGWGGEAVLKETKGEGHAFNLNAPHSEKAQELMQWVVDFITLK